MSNQSASKKPVYQLSMQPILVSELAKLIKRTGHDVGSKKLFKWLRDKGYLIKEKGNDYNLPTEKSEALGLFEIKETDIYHGNRYKGVQKTPKVNLKGQRYFVNKFAMMQVTGE